MSVASSKLAQQPCAARGENQQQQQQHQHRQQQYQQQQQQQQQQLDSSKVVGSITHVVHELKNVFISSRLIYS